MHALAPERSSSHIQLTLSAHPLKKDGVIVEFVLQARGAMGLRSL